MNYGYVFFGVIFVVTGIMFAYKKLQITSKNSQSKIISLNVGEILMLNGLIVLIKEYSLTLLKTGYLLQWYPGFSL